MTPETNLARWPAAGLLTLFAIVAVGCGGNAALLEDNDLLYEKSQQQLARRKFLEANESLGNVGLVTPVTDDVDADVKLALADVAFYQSGTENVVEAQSRYQQFLTFYPLDERATYADFQIGRCLLLQAEEPGNDQDFAQEAARHFNRMVSQLPDGSVWDQAARVELMRARKRLAEHEWLVAEFYLKRELWLGAASRLRALIDRYPGVPRREEAYLELAQMQWKSGDVEGACLSLNRLLAEYPDGELGEEADLLREEFGANEFAGACREERETVALNMDGAGPKR